ncbi:putative ribonuclease H-like domain-containing protein [Tanacetum coccineum]
MEFLNKTLHEYFSQEYIKHQTSFARTPEQNDVVKRWNRTLVKAARTMLSAVKVPLFFWAEAIETSSSRVVLKSSTVSTDDTYDKRQQQNTTPSTSTTVAANMSPLIIPTSTEPTIQASTQEPTVTASENINLADIQAETQE